MINIHHYFKKILLFFLIAVNPFFASFSFAQESVTIGVLAFQPKPLAEARWLPLMTYLNQSIGGVKIQIKALNYAELEEAVANKQIDFVLTNPANYVQIAHKSELSAPLATLINRSNGQPVRTFAGSILVLQDQTDIQSLKDLAGKRIATPSKKSFDGYMMQAYELHKAGIKMPVKVQIIETSMSHEAAIEALLNKQVDVAFVRSGVLESMQESGAIQAKQLRVLNQQPLSDFPFLTSTRQYPEWPIAAMPHVSEVLSVRVVGALLALPQNGEIAQHINIHGFRIPADYELVRETLRTLCVPPYDQTPEITLEDLWRQHQIVIIMSLVALTVIILLGCMLFAINRRLSESLKALKENNESLRIAAVAFDTQEAIFITDIEENIIKVNTAFTQMTGFTSEEVIGQTPRILHSGRHDDEFYLDIWQHLSQDGYWQGEVWNKRKNGEVFPVGQTITAIHNEQGDITHYLSAFNDITLSKENEERIKKLAFFDALTGLANRRLLQDHLKQARALSTRSKEYFALLYIDLDHFKTLNDTLGHDIGDELLIQVAQRLSTCVRESDTVSRTGGDEFVILLEEIGGEQSIATNHVQEVAEKVLATIHVPYLLKGNEYIISASIGISLFSDHQESVEEMMVRADLAMYQAKSTGRNGIRFFDPSMQEAMHQRSQMEAELRSALTNSEFVLFYQPKFSYKNEIVGYEALIRWQHPQKGLLTPFEFIKTAEECGLIIEIGAWVLNEACLQLKSWQQNPETKHLTIAVHISEVQLRRDNFVETVTQTVAEVQCDASKLELEITESILMQETQVSVEKMNRLKLLGITFALDDFGTGYSSLNYLKNLPITWVKIDKSFVFDMLKDPENEAIVKAILALSKALGLQAIAEGVETEAQRDCLIELGCAVLQGYLFIEPRPLPENMHPVRI